MRREETVSQQTEKIDLVENAPQSLHVEETAFSSSMNMAYVEMDDVPVKLIDPVAEVEKNLAHLQELQARMRFMMKEIRYLLKV